MIILDPSQVEKTREVTIQGPFGVHDTLREGLKSVSHDLAPKHPLQTSLKTSMDEDEVRRKILTARTIGQHLPLRMSLEKNMVAQPRRLGGLPCSQLGLEILMGQDEDFDVSDVLNRIRDLTFRLLNRVVPHWSPDLPNESLLN